MTNTEIVELAIKELDDAHEAYKADVANQLCVLRVEVDDMQGELSILKKKFCK